MTLYLDHQNGGPTSVVCIRSVAVITVEYGKKCGWRPWLSDSVGLKQLTIPGSLMVYLGSENGVQGGGRRPGCVIWLIPGWLCERARESKVNLPVGAFEHGHGQQPKVSVQKNTNQLVVSGGQEEERGDYVLQGKANSGQGPKHRIEPGSVTRLRIETRWGRRLILIHYSPDRTYYQDHSCERITWWPH
jgi:hypothetical protein